MPWRRLRGPRGPQNRRTQAQAQERCWSTRHDPSGHASASSSVVTAPAIERSRAASVPPRANDALSVVRESPRRRDHAAPVTMERSSALTARRAARDRAVRSARVLHTVRMLVPPVPSSVERRFVADPGARDASRTSPSSSSRASSSVSSLGEPPRADTSASCSDTVSRARGPVDADVSTSSRCSRDGRPRATRGAEGTARRSRRATRSR